MALTKVAPAGIGSTPGDGYRIGSSFLHSTGVEITNINATGILTAVSLDISGGIDFDGHTELDNVNISGVVTATTFKGDGSQLAGITVGVTTDAQYNMLSAWGSGDNFNGTNAQFNTLLGIDAGKAVTSGDYNVGVGYSALASVTNNGYNAVVGQLACQHINGASNAVLGYQSLQGVQGGSINCHYNVSIGDRAMQLAQGATNNVVIGWWAGKLINSGSNNIVIGYKAGDAILNASNNIIIGTEAAASSTTAQNEITLGNSSTTKFRIPGINFVLKDNGGTPSSGQVLTADGSGEGYWATSGPATGDTYVKLRSATAASATGSNTFAGSGAGAALDGSPNNGDHNTFYGRAAGAANDGGQNNVFLGSNAGVSNVSGHLSAVVGMQAFENGTGGENTVLGGRAARTSSFSGTNNTIIGYTAEPTSASTSNEITLGNSAVTKFRIPGLNYYNVAGAVGVNIAAPVAQLQVNSTKNAETDRHSAANYHLALRNPADDNGEAIGLSFGITSNATKVGAAILHERDGGGSQGSLQFYTSSDGNSLTERLRINSSGQLITGGTATPYATRSLTVQNVTGQTNTYVSIVAGSTSGVSGLTFGDAVGAAGNYAGMFEYYHNGDYLAYKQNASEKLKIHSTGQVEFKNGSFSNNVNCVMASGSTMEIGATATIKFRTATNNVLTIDSNGHTIPGGYNGAKDLGSSSYRWRNVYTSDIDLCNESRGGNEVDGTWGAYTIQEGEDDLFLINRRSGKKYKFNLTEVS